MEVSAEVATSNYGLGAMGVPVPAAVSGTSYPGYNAASFPAEQSADNDFANVPMPPPNPMGGASDAGGAPAGGASGVGVAGLTEDQILSDLPSAEQKAYQEAFITFAGGSPAPLDNQQMRSFLANNASIDDIDVTLLQAMNQDSMSIDLNCFLELLRNNAMSDGDAIGQFTQLSQDGVSLASEECRTGLTMMGMEKFNVN